MEIRCDTNPTPTRFLLECGAFTPGLGMNLEETYNPFDASLKFLSTGTPLVESNPFDSSFRPINTHNSNNNTNNNNGAFQPTVQVNEGQHLYGSERQSWTDMMFDEVVMPVPQMSPSPTFSSASPSPPIHSPPTQTVFLAELPPSITRGRNPMNPQTHECSSVYENPAKTKGLINCESNSALGPHNYHSDFRHNSNNENNNDGEDERDFDKDDDISYYSQDPSRRCSEIGNMAISMSELDMRRLSTISDIQSSNDNSESIDEFDQSSMTAKSKMATPGSRKSKNGNGKSSSRKRTSIEEETPEMKRQKFLERNRMAASKCREKKRLQTLKTIEDADEITSRNQALHETLEELQEEVRVLKNQILSHRGCGCDVIQKFVQTSFEFSTPTSTYAIPQTQTSAPMMNLY
ncbi:hypothetical protein BGZ76_000055 [Entomortierella beljakovae]|nr:hypothetical protein BGZ76_000055 [Entomortierella beljakovae]